MSATTRRIYDSITDFVLAGHARNRRARAYEEHKLSKSAAERADDLAMELRHEREATLRLSEQNAVLADDLAKARLELASARGGEDAVAAQEDQDYILRHWMVRSAALQRVVKRMASAWGPGMQSDGRTPDQVAQAWTNEECQDILNLPEASLQAWRSKENKVILDGKKRASPRRPLP